MIWGSGFITIINYASTAEGPPSNSFLELAHPPMLLLDDTQFELLEQP